jgi:hypothetical protein
MRKVKKTKSKKSGKKTFSCTNGEAPSRKDSRKVCRDECHQVGEVDKLD